MNNPALTIFFEGGQETLNLGRWEAKALKAGLDEPHALPLNRSFGAIAVVIEGSALHAAHLLVDGRPVRLQAMGGLLVMRFQLNNDIEVHRIAFVHVPELACTVDLTVVHQHRVNIGGLEQVVSKWSAADFEREFERFRPILSQQQQVGRDPWSHSFKFGSTSELNSALLQALGNISHLLASLRTPELLTDFAELTAAGIDREAVLTYLKQDSRRLVRDVAGSIELAGERYTTDVNQRLLSRSARVNLVPVADILEHCSELLRRSSAPAVASVMLRYAATDLRTRFRVRGAANSSSIELLLSRRMQSPIGSELQAQLRLLLACAHEKVGRDIKDHGLLWLQQSVRDFDLFQATGFFALALAFGFSAVEALTTAGVLKKPGVTLMNGNRAGALDEFFATTGGWRHSSVQPSEYRPDLVVQLDGKLPVVLDSKFAISGSDALPLPAAPLKEVQAYLDEFDLPGAVLIVPKVLNSAHLGVDGYVTLSGKDRSGRERLLLGVPVEDSGSHQAQLALKKAVERVADLV